MALLLLRADATHQQTKRSRYFSPAPATSSSSLSSTHIAAADPRTLKSFALASSACNVAESRHRRRVHTLRTR
jgi:F-box/leucine-rich repeat protein 2/20